MGAINVEAVTGGVVLFLLQMDKLARAGKGLAPGPRASSPGSRVWSKSTLYS